jgi:predicted ATPase/DNA-binding SARP family transcriptional activator
MRGTVERRSRAPAAGRQDLRIQVLGGLCVWTGARPVEAAAWRRRKAAGLLKLLALAPGHRLHREQVQDALWPDLDPQTAANNLHRTLHHVRQALEPDRPREAPSAYLHLDGPAVALRAPDTLWVDAVAFEAAAAAAQRTRDPAAWEQALALYTGELLPDDRYEDWAAPRRETLSQLHLRLLRGLAAIREAAGDVAGAVDTLERVLVASPADEAAHVALMRLYAAAGSRAQALRQYERLREALRQELDTTPDPATDALYERIRAGGEPALSGAAAVAPAAKPPPLPPLAPTPRQDESAPEPRELFLRLLHAPLPVPPRSFVGRSLELQVLRRQVLERGVRLVTLTGPGGVGKTRLAIQLAGNLRDAFPDGIAFVSLESLSDPRLVWGAVAQALGLQTATAEAALEHVQALFSPRRALLVLDNVEHLLAIAADVAGLVAGCHRLVVLVTSRAPLRVAAEWPFAVPPCSLPDPDGAGSAEASLRSDAVHLFVERSRDVSPAFVLAPENSAIIGEICRRLDGLPLAIELAAARLRLLSPQALLDRLAVRLPLLTGGPRDAPARQQTLRDTIAWSDGLLAPDEQALFRRLAVFSGGFTLDAAEAVADLSAPLPQSPALASSHALDHLGALVENSLVVRERETGGEPRFRMLETIREYGLEQQAAHGETETVGQRHAAFYLALAEQSLPAMHGPRQIEWYDRFEREHDNLRAALRWTVEHDAAEVGVRLADALRWYWEVRGHAGEGRQWLHSLLALPLLQEPTASRARALAAAAHMAHVDGDIKAAHALSGECLAISRTLGADRFRADALLFFGRSAFRLDGTAEARSALEESLECWQKLDEPWGTAQALEYLGAITRDSGDPDAARPLYEAALAHRWEMRDWRGMAQTLQSLGNMAYQQGDRLVARRRSEASLALARKSRDLTRIVVSLRTLGHTAAEDGDVAAARACFEELLAIAPAARGLWGSAEWCWGLAIVELAELERTQRNPALAESRFAESLRFTWVRRARLRDMGEGCFAVLAGRCLVGLAANAADQGRSERAARLLGAAEALADTESNPETLPVLMRREHQEGIQQAARVRASLSQHALASAWLAEGRATALPDIVRYALEAHDLSSG